MAKFRHERTERLIAESISSMVLSDEIRDPRVSSLVSVTGVRATKDYSQAIVLISGYLSPEQLSGAVEALNHAAGFIQSRVGHRLAMRTTPRLVFRVDTSIKEGFEVIQRMKGLH